VTALVISGWGYGTSSMRILEVSVNSPAGVPIWPLKMMIPIGATLLTLQGLAEVLRCVQCLKDGRWAPRLHDVEELENQILQEHAAKAAAANAPGEAR
jgi:TRAP-type mannitol/chloroaromatic compound transport system permease small subunit